MNGRRQDDHPQDIKHQLLGNGSLTVAARIMSVVGVPVACGLLAFMGNEIWTELKANRIERQTVAVTIGDKIAEAAESLIKREKIKRGESVEEEGDVLDDDDLDDDDDDDLDDDDDDADDDEGGEE